MSNSIQVKNRPGCLIQLLWFIFIGWWAGFFWLLGAWLLMATVVGIPLGIMMINQIPRVMALRGPEAFVVSRSNGSTMVIRPPQVNLFLRIVYFIFVGWWASLVWAIIGYLLCLTFIGLPVGLWMIDQTPAILSLYRGY
jgi:uncharacterized membrane protein YccF (DUF307 family)